MNRHGLTLIEILVSIVVVTVALSIGQFVANQFGAWAGIGAGAGTAVISVSFLGWYWSWLARREQKRLLELREKYRGIYRVVSLPSDPKVIAMAPEAEIRVGDYAWEAEPARDDGLIYLHGLTLDWTVVWHVGLRPITVEQVTTKPYSQYDSWHPYWATPPSLPPCPYPVVERETLTIGRPHHSQKYFVNPSLYQIREPE